MNARAEWLEADGLGGFASGCADGVRTRRYHALLLAATTPPTGRVVLVNGVDTWIETDVGRFALSSQRYSPDVTHPDGAARIARFERDPWPTWTYALPAGIEVTHELVVPHGSPVVALAWRLDRPAKATLIVRPFFSGRDTHSTHHENGTFRFDASVDDSDVRWHPYERLPAIRARSNGRYAHAPEWYRNFQYDEERARGLDFIEDLASPGEFRFALGDGPAVLSFGAGDVAMPPWEDVAAAERARRARFATPLHRAADDYVVQRGRGKTIVAGYPWFSDWGRDTFIAVRGLCIAGGRLADARDILVEWSGHVSEGMLPNYFPEAGQAAEYNSVDASLWFVVAARELLDRVGSPSNVVSRADRAALEGAVEAILDGYSRGTRFGIRADDDGLLAAGAPGVQLTWMDARVDGREITPRIGKPVEIQALWINALRLGGRRSSRWAKLAERAQTSFADRFWLESEGYLADVVDDDHRPGVVDAAFRPNQILAVGGLPIAVLDGDRARRVVDAVEARLWTPAGLRSLASDSPDYVPHYGGDPRARDAAYHQGTVWPWIAGAFIEAWARVRGDSAEAREAARHRFLEPMISHYDTTVLGGHLAEIADADAPHEARGCPFQAWSVGEAVRVAAALDARRPQTPTRRPAWPEYAPSI
jgi:predicted glycogen debranching enzyme